MKRTTVAVLALAIGAAGIAAAVFFLGQEQGEAPPDTPVTVENTRAPGEVSGEWDEERRENALPN